MTDKVTATLCSSKDRWVSCQVPQSDLLSFCSTTQTRVNLKESQLNQEECNTCRHLSPPPPPPVTTTTIIRIRTRLATHRHSNYPQPFKKLVMIFCDHDTDPLLDPPKSRPQNGGRFWIKNRPPKRCPPTVGGHSSGGLKWYAEAAPDLVP